ncbi:hypothetical protein HN873_044239 [Arachis hypogaea]
MPFLLLFCLSSLSPFCSESCSPLSRGSARRCLAVLLGRSRGSARQVSRFCSLCCSKIILCSSMKHFRGSKKDTILGEESWNSQTCAECLMTRHLSVERNRVSCVKLFPEARNNLLPVSSFVIRLLSSAKDRKALAQSEVRDKLLSSREGFMWGIEVPLPGRFIFHVEFLNLKTSSSNIYGVEPAESNILNGGKPDPHHITGNGVGFKPDILDMDVMEKVLEVSSEDAVNMARVLALKEGLMVGISSGANTVAALRLASIPENKGKLIVVMKFSFKTIVTLREFD